MIDGLIGGTLYGKPAKRTGNSGKPFYTAKVKAAAGDGETLLVNVIAFSSTVGESLLALDEGDSVSLSGALTPKVWTPPNGDPRPSLDLVAHAITTAYHVTRKRKAIDTSNIPTKPTQKAKDAATAFFSTPKDGAELEDDLPWETA